jgi:hypothetical protein
MAPGSSSGSATAVPALIQATVSGARRIHNTDTAATSRMTRAGPW